MVNIVYQFKEAKLMGAAGMTEATFKKTQQQT